MASASLEDRFEQITIHDDNDNGAQSYHKSKVSAYILIVELRLTVLGLCISSYIDDRPWTRQ